MPSDHARKQYARGIIRPAITLGSIECRVQDAQRIMAAITLSEAWGNNNMPSDHARKQYARGIIRPAITLGSIECGVQDAQRSRCRKHGGTKCAQRSRSEALSVGYNMPSDHARKHLDGVQYAQRENVAEARLHQGRKLGGKAPGLGFRDSAKMQCSHVRNLCNTAKKPSAVKGTKRTQPKLPNLERMGRSTA
jgi:hypothetical protein